MPDGTLARAAGLGTYFLSGVLAVNISQIVGAPLYLVNQDWYNAWIAFTKQSFSLLVITLTQYWAPTQINVSGDASVRGQLQQDGQGNLQCLFPKRAVLMANHQIYTDWLYLWWIAYANKMHPYLYIVLKESLRRIPLIGWGMQLSRFIFLKRNWEMDKPRLAAHLKRLAKGSDPMWLLLFPEGTNLASSTRERSAAWAERKKIRDMQHVLLPRSTGLQFCLDELKGSIEWLYDCTIAYEGVPRGQYAQDIYTLKAAYAQGKPPKKVHMYWRRFRITDIPLSDPVKFELWLRVRWMEKDGLIEHFYDNGRFPADVGVEKSATGHVRRGAGLITTTVRARHWYELLQMFVPAGLLGLVLYSFYGALPRAFLSSIGKLSSLRLDNLKQIMSGQFNDAFMSRISNGFQRNAVLEAARTGKLPQLALDNSTIQKLLPKGVTISRPTISSGTVRALPPAKPSAAIYPSSSSSPKPQSKVGSTERTAKASTSSPKGPNLTQPIIKASGSSAPTGNTPRDSVTNNAQSRQQAIVKQTANQPAQVNSQQRFKTPGPSAVSRPQSAVLAIKAPARKPATNTAPRIAPSINAKSINPQNSKHPQPPSSRKPPSVTSTTASATSITTKTLTPSSSGSDTNDTLVPSKRKHARHVDRKAVIHQSKALGGQPSMQARRSSTLSSTNLKSPDALGKTRPLPTPTAAVAKKTMTPKIVNTKPTEGMPAPQAASARKLAPRTKRAQKHAASNAALKAGAKR